ncbi:F-box protein: endocytic membrane traffic, recycling ReCYcling 1, partial [Cladochytrium tenue]
MGSDGDLASPHSLLPHLDDPAAVPLPASSSSPPTAGVDPAELAAVARLSSRLKQLPGGNLLPAGTKYLETGTLWGGLDAVVAVPEVDAATAAAAATATATASEASSDPTTAGTGSSDQASGSTSPQDPAAALPSSSSSSSPPKITAAIPQLRKSNFVVGAGGLKVIGHAARGVPIGAAAITASGNHGGAVRRKAPGLNGLRARDAFRAIYSELSPYYLDFRHRGQDSLAFRAVVDPVEQAALLRRVRLLARARLVPGMRDADFGLETAIGWFESTVLGRFERAYDAGDVEAMRECASACCELNGGAACVQLFVSKNPIFFDHAVNPSLAAAPKLTDAGGSGGGDEDGAGGGSGARPGGTAKGYDLADEFAAFMDRVLGDCRKQAAVVGRVFPPEADAMTAFVTRVFEDSIAEYLTAVLRAARDGEPPAVYLHTLATAVHCCTQFLDYIQAAEPGVAVRTDRIRSAIAAIFRPYTTGGGYVSQELELLARGADGELRRWARRKERRASVGGAAGDAEAAGAAYLMDAEKAQAHKRQVMSAMKSVLYAPMALGRTLAIMGGGSGSSRGGKGQSESLLDDGDGGSAQPAAAAAAAAARKAVSTTYQLDDDSLGSLVSLELCLTLMHANKESLGRVLVVTSAVDTGLLLNRLSKSMPVADWSNTGHRAVNIDSLQFFELVHVADLIHQMIDAYFAEDVRAWIDEQDFLSDVMVEKKAFDRAADDNVAQGMDKAIQVLINQVEYILVSEQAPADFNPPETGAVMDLKPTKACRNVIACLNAHTRLLNGVTNKDTLEVFFGEVGVRLF